MAGLFELTPRALTLLRVERSLQQKELSERSGVGRAAISRYESGKASPSLDNLGRLLEAMGVGPVEFARTLERLRDREVEDVPRRVSGHPPGPPGSTGAYLVIDLGEFVADDPRQIEKAVESARELARRAREAEQEQPAASSA